jgi:microcin-processing metallopeptidase PmbA/TldD-like protein
MSRPGRSAGAGDRTSGGDPAARILAAARAAGCRSAEIYLKTSASRQIAWEPPLVAGGTAHVAGGAAHVAVTRAVEAGIGLRIVDTEGRSGMAWTGGGPAELETPDDTLAAGLVRDALAAAGASCDRAAGTLRGRESPAARHDGAAGPSSAEASSGRPGEEGPSTNAEPLDLVDPECLDRPDTALVDRVEAAAREVATAGEGVLEVDRILATEARTSVRLVRLDGFDASYDRTIAALSVALVPAAAGATAVTEERSACRLTDLDAIAVVRDAILRGLPPRVGGNGLPVTPVPAPCAPAPDAPATVETAFRPPASKPRVILAPRAAATLVAALAPWIAGGAIASPRPSALTVVDDGRARGRPGSAPFDGSGAPTRRILLIDRGRAVGRVDPTTGPFQRHSYRDIPAAGPACLVILPGQRRDDPRSPSASSGTESRAPQVRAAVIEVRATFTEVRAGGEIVVQIRRGDWDSGHAADGLYWEGSPAALVAAIFATLDDFGWYQVGLPIGAPSVVIEGLGPWRLPGHEN